MVKINQEKLCFRDSISISFQKVSGLSNEVLLSLFDKIRGNVINSIFEIDK